MKKLFLLPLALGSVLLSSCQDEDFGYESSKIAYEKTMSQMLGEVAPDQTWVNAEQGYVTISEECQNVKVFDGLTGKVIANYDNLRPGSKVYYNATIGYNPTISNGAVAMEVKNGQTVSFASLNNTASPVTVTYGNTDQSIHTFKDVDPNDYVNFRSNMIEKDFHRYGNDAEEIRKNVEYVATSSDEGGMSTFVMYPCFWDSEEPLTVGIYYYDPATGNVVVDNTIVFQNREGNTVLFGNNSSSTQKMTNWECATKGKSTDRPSSASAPFTQWDVFPIEITVQKNLVFGFWIKGAGDQIYFSNPALNDDCTEDDCSHSGTFDPDKNGKEKYYRPFYPVEEEWAGEPEPLYLGMNANSHKQNGYYDIYFVLKAVRNINYETSSYTLCFEDLGATSWQDMDFNDCVLKLTCANGQKTAGLQLLAAGGVLPIKVTYNGTSVWNEIHEALGKGLVPVNANQFKTGVTKDVETADAVSATITLPDSWTIQSLVAKIGLDVDGKTQVSIPETTGDYPKGFAVAGDFQWPGEQQNITTVYGDFSTWAAKPDFSYWYPWSAE